MRKLAFMICLVGLGVAISSANATAQTVDIVAGSAPSSGFDIGVNSSEGETNWLYNEDGHMKMSYPANQAWGAVFITIGKPKQPPRPSRDFSDFETLSVEMKGRFGAEQLEVGLKTNEQPDDGSETKIPVKLTSEWQEYKFPLEKFNGVNMKSLYVVTEFVFTGPKAATAYFRNVRYSGETTSADQAIVGTADVLPVSRAAEIEPITPQVNISYPSRQSVISSRSNTRSSILVRGTAEGIPEGFKLFLVVHPTQNDNVWASEVNLNGKQWISQAYLGGPSGFPENNSVFEIFTTVRESNHPLPPKFIIQNEQLLHPSAVTTVQVKVVSWLDRAQAIGKDWQVSVPVAAFITLLGAALGNLAGSNTKKRVKDKGDQQNRA